VTGVTASTNRLYHVLNPVTVFGAVTTTVAITSKTRRDGYDGVDEYVYSANYYSSSVV